MLAFLESAYQAGAELAQWDVDALRSSFAPTRSDPGLTPSTVNSPRTRHGTLVRARMRAMADDDIDRLILELHSSGTGSTAAGEPLRLEQWLRLLASRGGQ